MKFGSLMFVMVLATLLTAAKPAISVGFQQVSVPDPAGKPLPVAIWYPSDAPAVDSPLGMFVQPVATDAPVSGKQLPLVLFPVDWGPPRGATTIRRSPWRRQDS